MPLLLWLSDRPFLLKQALALKKSPNFSLISHRNNVYMFSHRFLRQSLQRHQKTRISKFAMNFAISLKKNNFQGQFCVFWWIEKIDTTRLID